MKKSLRLWSTSLAAIALCSITLVAFAQNQNTPRPRTGAAAPGGSAAPATSGRASGSGTDNDRTTRTTTSTTAGGQAGSSDHLIVEWLRVGIEGEIALGNLASKRAQNDRVKDFAKMMVEDHGKYVQELQQAAGQGGGAPGAAQPGNRSGRTTPGREGNSGGGPGDDTPAGAPAGVPGSAAAGSGSRPASGTSGTRTGFGGAASSTSSASSSSHSDNDAIQLKEEIGKQCVENATRDLSSKQGAQFDKAYIGQQIAAHGDMLATLQVFERHASGQLKDVINKGIQTTQHHKQEAEKIMAELDAGGAGSSGGGAATRTERKSSPAK